MALKDTPVTSTDPARMEVEQYLSVDRETLSSGVSVLAVWKGIEPRFPILARVARDSLSVCASSAESERQFSKARKVLDPWRNRLAWWTVCASHSLFEIVVSATGTVESYGEDV